MVAKDGELQRLTTSVDAEAAAAHGERSKSGALQGRLEGALEAIAALEAKAAGGKAESSHAAANAQVRRQLEPFLPLLQFYLGHMKEPVAYVCTSADQYLLPQC